MDSIKVENLEIKDRFQKEFMIKHMQSLESRLEIINVPPIKTNNIILLNIAKTLIEGLWRLLDGNQDFLQTHWLNEKKALLNSQRPPSKKKILKIQLRYFKNYLFNQKDIDWDNTQHTEILNIYWYSTKEVQIKEKMLSCLDFLEEEICKLEKHSHASAFCSASEPIIFLQHQHTATA